MGPGAPRRAALLALVACLAACATGSHAGGPEPATTPAAAPAVPRETVVLLHGLGRTRRSMAGLGRALQRAGYGVINVGYPSRSKDLPALTDHLSTALGEAGLRPSGPSSVHFVTHSAGGIVARAYLAGRPDFPIGRMVQLAPPNQGSSLAAELRDLPFFAWLLGPLASSLEALPPGAPGSRNLGLPPPDYPLGVIAGDHSIFITSIWVEGKDDGIVGVEETRVPGMADHLIVPRTHSFIMHSRTVQRQVLHFLREGRFERALPVPEEPAAAGQL